MNLPRQGFRKLLLDRQTDTTEIIYHVICGWSATNNRMLGLYPSELRPTTNHAAYINDTCW